MKGKIRVEGDTIIYLLKETTSPKMEMYFNSSYISKKVVVLDMKNVIVEHEQVLSEGEKSYIESHITKSAKTNVIFKHIGN